jgi:transposase
VLDQTSHHPVSTVYAAIELSKKSWVVAIMQPAKDQPSIHRIKGGAFSDLVMKLRTATRGGERLLVCYEAGYDGFWLARSLKMEKIDCRVLDHQPHQRVAVRSRHSRRGAKIATYAH